MAPRKPVSKISKGKGRKKVRARVNQAPTTTLDVYVFGHGNHGELGLGKQTANGLAPTDVLRPRRNPHLSGPHIGVVQIACGGRHGIALTNDNDILTWGSNDYGALGRDTSDNQGGDADGEDDDDDNPLDENRDGLDPEESLPDYVDMSEMDEDDDIRWTQVVASNNASFACTDDGRVFGWGTFIANDGMLGFDMEVLTQKTPKQISGLKDIRMLAAGSNHVLALDGKGKVWSWGSGEQDQLARRVLLRHHENALRPGGIGRLPVRGAKPVKIACGPGSSFIVDQHGRAYAWGDNTWSQLGVPLQNGYWVQTQLRPCVIQGLSGHVVESIDGGLHHSVACTDDGTLFTWGRIEAGQVGLRDNAFNRNNAHWDPHNRPRSLMDPTANPDVSGVASVAAGSDHSFAITDNGQVYSWGFGDHGRTGQGNQNDTRVPTLINNPSIRNKTVLAADGGASSSVLTCASWGN